MKKRISAAIVGLGRWGQNLHAASLDCEALSVSRVVTRTPSKVKDYCASHGLTLSDQLDDALEDPGIDAVILATPHSQHFGQICAAAEAGKHVFTEKPFTLDPREADEALALIDSADLKVAIGHNRRFAPNTLALRSMIDNGELGDILHLDGVFSAQMAQAKGRWRDNREESPAGGMTSLGIHAVDMLINLGGEISELSARSDRIHTDCAFDDSTVASLRFQSGATGVLTTLASAPMQWRITVYGTNAWVELRELNLLIHQPVDGGLDVQRFDGFEYPGLRSIRDMLEAFAADVLGGDPYPISPAQISHGTHVLGVIITGAKRREWVKL